MKYIDLNKLSPEELIEYFTLAIKTIQSLEGRADYQRSPSTETELSNSKRFRELLNKGLVTIFEGSVWPSTKSDC